MKKSQLFILVFIGIFVFISNPVKVFSQSINLIYKIDFKSPDLPVFKSDSVLEMGWGANAFRNWIDPYQKGDKAYTMLGTVFGIQNDGKTIIPENLLIKCVITTSKDWDQFSSPINDDGSFIGSVFISEARTKITFKFSIYQIDPNTGKTQGQRLAYFVVQLD